MNGTGNVAPRAIGRRILTGVLAVALVGCGEGSGQDFLSPVNGGGGSTSDTTPPTVVSTNPVNFATGVPTNATVSVTFSENLDSASVTNAAFSLDNGVTGGIVVSGAIATLTPTPGLPAGTTVHGTLSTAIRDRAGNALAAPVTFQFTTAP
jgi:hypothetical protein